MKNLMFLAIALCALMMTSAVAKGSTGAGVEVADGESTDVRILLPLVIEEPIQGAFGSVWVTRTAILNSSDRPILINAYDQACPVICWNDLPTPPAATFYPNFYLGSNRLVEGIFLEVAREDLRQVQVQLRAQDLSRQGVTWGTELPVIPEFEAYTERLDLLDIPRRSGFRSMLRVYDFDPIFDVQRRMIYRIFAVRPELAQPVRPAVAPDRLVASGEVTFRTSRHPRQPGYLELPLEAVVPEDVELYRVELEPAEPNLRFWAFVSVTHNESQHVTTIAPVSPPK